MSSAYSNDSLSPLKFDRLKLSDIKKEPEDSPPKIPEEEPAEKQSSSDDSEVEIINVKPASTRILRSLVPKESIDVTEKVRKESEETRKMWYKVLTLGLICIIAIFLANFKFRNGKTEDYLANLSLELKENVYGQDEAIRTLLHFFTFEQNVNVFIFIGGTGVGKSYVGTMIKRNFPFPYNTFHFYPPIIKFQNSVLTNVSWFNCNLIFLENLKPGDYKDLVSLVSLIYEKREHLCVHVFAMVNPETVDNQLNRKMDLKKSIEDVKRLFDEVDVPVEVISFKSLDEGTVERCIRKAASEDGIQLTSEQFAEVKQLLLEQQSGCKGAYAKVKVYKAVH